MAEAIPGVSNDISREHFRSSILQLHAVVEEIRILHDDLASFLETRRKIASEASLSPKLSPARSMGGASSDWAREKAEKESLIRDTAAINRLDQQHCDAVDLRSKFDELAKTVEEPFFSQIAAEIGDPTYWATLFENLDIAASLCWGTRITRNQKILLAEKKHALREMRELEEKVLAMPSENRILTPEFPSSPGDRIQCSCNTAAEARRKLQQLMDEADAAPSSENGEGGKGGANGDSLSPDPMLDLRSPAERTNDIYARQLAIQLSFRPYEDDKDFENELSPPRNMMGEERAESPNLASLNPPIHVGQQHVRPQLPFHSPDLYMNTFLAQSAQQQAIDTQNSREEFHGYVSKVFRRVAALRATAGVEFRTVPGGRYSLGKTNECDWATLAPVASTTDRAARFDRRTQLWLISHHPAHEDAHIELPLHHMYTTAPREIDLPPMFVSREPFTKKQFRTLLEDRRFRRELQSVAAEKYLSAPEGKRLHFWPTFVCGTMHNYMEETVPLEPPEADDDLLEVPYFVAEKICAAFGGIVCPIDAWEAAARGVESLPFLFFEDDAAPTKYTPEDSDRPRMLLESLEWALPIDGGHRIVHGKSTRLRNLAAFKNRESPCGLRNVLRLGCEWNSTWSIVPPLLIDVSSSLVTGTGGDDDTNDNNSLSVNAERAPWVPPVLENVPRTHVLRSTSDYNIQVLLDGKITGAELHNLDGTERISLAEALEGVAGGSNPPLLEKAGCPVIVSDDVEHNEFRNHESFIGPALFTFALPNRGIPVAAFRIAFPCFSGTNSWIETQQRDAQTARGFRLSFAEIVSQFGTPKEDAEIMNKCAFEDTAYDPFFGEESVMFLAAGFDLKFAREEPKPLVGVVLHAALAPDEVPIIERGDFQAPVATDHTTEFLLPKLRSSEWAKWLAAQSNAEADGYFTNPSSAAVTTETQLFFQDTITSPQNRRLQRPVEVHMSLTSLPPSDANPTPGVAVTRVEVRWIRSRIR